MVLVDTSVWIRFLSNRAPYSEELDELLALDEAAGHELIYGELLIGERGGRQKLLAAYERIPWAGTIPHREVADFVKSRNLHGKGVGWIDIQILASAIVRRFPLWTADAGLSALAFEFGVGYKPSA